jgi:hypothetical protein
LLVSGQTSGNNAVQRYIGQGRPIADAGQGDRTSFPRLALDRPFALQRVKASASR